jgi:UDP-glucose:(heptosyl)LPS alpha-1,3-glucosyltransferase
MNTRHLKIAIIRQRYDAFGGAERFVDRALHALTNRQTQITLLTRRWKGDSPFHIHQCAPFYIGRTWRDRSFSHCVCAHVNAADYDLVQSHERIACCDIYRAGDGVHREWLAQRNRVLGPFARLAQSMNPWHRYTLAAEHHVFENRNIEAVICISRMVKDDIIRHFDVPQDKLYVIYNGIDTEQFHPRLKLEHRSQIRQRLGISERETVFLFVGSGFQRKGVPILLQAMTRLAGNGHLLIVGKDKKLDEYKRLGGQLGITDKVHFIGPQIDVKPYYGTADVFVLPTLYEPFGNVVLEAMASGLAVITSNKCGGADIIEHGRNGYIGDALDLDALVTHMSNLSNREQQQAMGEAARIAAEPLTLEFMCRNMARLYDELLSNR